MRQITITAVAALAALLLAGCGNTTAPPAPAATPATAKPTPAAYDLHDCTALLERNYAADATRDASEDPECADLTREEYVEAVGTVLLAHADEMMDQAATEMEWDLAWEETDPAQQDLVCERLRTDGAATVGLEMMEAAGDEAGVDQLRMAEYFFDEKC